MTDLSQPEPHADRSPREPVAPGSPFVTSSRPGQPNPPAPRDGRTTLPPEPPP